MKPVAVYLSGASREAMRVQTMALRLGKATDGMAQIADRWFDGADAWSGKDDTHPREAQVYFAEEHERAIRASRLFWLLWPRKASYGALYELGYAAAHRHHAMAPRLPLVVSGKGCSQTIYTGAADYRDESDECGLVEVARRVLSLSREGV